MVQLKMRSLIVFVGCLWGFAPLVGGQENTGVRCDQGGFDIEYGERRPVLDGLGNILGIPRKILLWDRRVDNHNVSEQTVGEVASYLYDRNLQDVKVRVNQYDPRGEWRRLVANRQISPGWKYTFGTLKHLEYTLLPGRIFGGDEYNPYTNSLYLYSDVPVLGLAESAYAKDIHERSKPGVYAASQSFPIIAMWHESLATNEVIHYIALRGSEQELDRARRLLYARYGMELGGQLSGIGDVNGLQIGGVYQIVGALGGHALASMENDGLIAIEPPPPASSSVTEATPMRR